MEDHPSLALLCVGDRIDLVHVYGEKVVQHVVLYVESLSFKIIRDCMVDFSVVNGEDEGKQGNTDVEIAGTSEARK